MNKFLALFVFLALAAAAQGVKIEIRCDDRHWAFVNGKQDPIANGNNRWNQKYTYEVPSLNQLNVKCLNTGGAMGIMVRIDDKPVSANELRCSSIATDDWMSSGFDASSWDHPATSGFSVPGAGSGPTLSGWFWPVGGEAKKEAFCVLKRLNYIGCYRDKGNRALPNARTSTPNNTPDKCVGYCRGKGYKYAGLQYSRECWCGNSFNPYGEANNCNMKCSGDATNICGGGWANSVYATGDLGTKIEVRCDDQHWLYINGKVLPQADGIVGWNRVFSYQVTDTIHSLGLKCFDKGRGARGVMLRVDGRPVTDDLRCNKKAPSGWEGMPIEDLGWRKVAKTGFFAPRSGPVISDWVWAENGPVGESAYCRLLVTEIKFQCDDVHQFFINGRKESEGSRWNAVNTIHHLGAIKSMAWTCKNLGGPFGTLLQVNNDNINHGRVRCTNKPGDGWFGAEIDDKAWPVSEAIKGPSQQFKGGEWLWVGTNDAQTYCRFSAPKIVDLGCWKDDRERTLDKTTMESIPYQSQGHCQKRCRELGYSFCAVQYSRECFCGHKHDDFTRLGPGKCDKNCAGIEEENCGGTWAQHVFTTGLETDILLSEEILTHLISGCQ